MAFVGRKPPAWLTASGAACLIRGMDIDEFQDRHVVLAKRLMRLSEELSEVVDEGAEDAEDAAKGELVTRARQKVEEYDQFLKDLANEEEWRASVVQTCGEYIESMRADLAKLASNG